MQANAYEINGRIQDPDYIASNGDRYFSVDDFWIIVSYKGPNKPTSMRVEPKGIIQ